MAWDVADIQEQVQMATSHDGLNERVIGWTNRVLMEICGKAYWTKNTQQTKIGDAGAKISATVASRWINAVTNIGTKDVIDIHHIEYCTNTTIVTQVLVRQSPRDFYAGYHNAAITVTSGDNFRFYVVPKWTTYSAGATTRYYMPLLDMRPVKTTATNMFYLYYLSALSKVDSGDDTNWVLEKYPLTVLAGVLRYANLFLGAADKYMYWKGMYENGIHDMLINEETVVASTPSFRAIYPEDILRGEQ